MAARLLPVMLSGVLIAAACGESPAGLRFPEGFIWGAATAAHQVEGGNTNNNWYQFETLPRFAGKTTDPSGAAADSYNRHDEDARIAEELGLNAYRLSVEWSRIEPRRDAWDEQALAHYDAVIDALIGRGIRPMITLHHFTDPIWVQDLSRLDACTGSGGPVDDSNLCGWSNEEVRDAWVAFVQKVAQRYGDRVDHWITFNEPMNYILSGYVLGGFPPGRMAAPFDEVVSIMRNMLDGHARAYRTIHREDTTDADGDGRSAVVGPAQAVILFEPADPTDADDREAAAQATYFMNRLFVDALVQGGLDTTLDGSLDEPHPDWKGTLDLIGIQYYFRSPMVKLPLVEPIDFMFCSGVVESYMPGFLKALGCPEPHPDDVTLMGYEHHPEGLYRIAVGFAERYPGIPLMVTENGISTCSGRRRAESIVRHLRQVHRAMEQGADVTGYLHWSLIDNFEWAEGYDQPFGLYRVDFDTFARSPTEGAEVYRRIVGDNGISEDLLDSYDDDGPLSPESSTARPGCP